MRKSIFSCTIEKSIFSCKISFGFWSLSLNSLSLSLSLSLFLPPSPLSAVQYPDEGLAEPNTEGGVDDRVDGAVELAQHVMAMYTEREMQQFLQWVSTWVRKISSQRIVTVR